MNASLDWNALAHRALVTAALYGIGPKAGAERVVCSLPSALGGTHGSGMIVTVDAPELGATSFAAARDAMTADGVLAVVVGSRSALGLLTLVPGSAGARTDAFARAARWAEIAARAPRAPAVGPSRLREIVAAASSAGLVLVEPDVPHVRAQPKDAADRAVLATILLGATARPLLFVREGRAPKGGLARIRDERLLDGWIEGRSRLPTATPPSLLGAALEALAAADGPMPGKDLLREARARWAEGARATGTRAPTSASDGAVLAKELRRLWLDGAIELYAAAPGTPLVAR